VAKPVVDRLEQQLQGQAEVIRVNLMGQMGATLAKRYSVRGVPTMLVFDGEGNVIYSRAGIPNAGAIVQAAAAAAGQ
jgi:thioredoxin-related protein